MVEERDSLGVRLLKNRLLLGISLLVLNFMLSKFLEPSNNQMKLMDSYQTSTILFTIFAIFIGPIFEEACFRWLILKIFKILGNNKEYLYFLVSSLIFAFCHEQSQLLPFIVYFVFGLAFVLIYSHRYELRQSITSHVMYNGLVILTALFWG